MKNFFEIIKPKKQKLEEQEQVLLDRINQLRIDRKYLVDAMRENSHPDDGPRLDSIDKFIKDLGGELKKITDALYPVQ